MKKFKEYLEQIQKLTPEQEKKVNEQLQRHLERQQKINERYGIKIDPKIQEASKVDLKERLTKEVLGIKDPSKGFYVPGPQMGKEEFKKEEQKQYGKVAEANKEMKQQALAQRGPYRR